MEVDDALYFSSRYGPSYSPQPSNRAGPRRFTWYTYVPRTHVGASDSPVRYSYHDYTEGVVPRVPGYIAGAASRGCI
ncbi:hypothetical protein FA13DRAFT_665753 [Coprinellus micaceus]|uniref:Uncharacterized protein n=1 Tax=Coprinellus micaceus TaxID=71717 RepID=A0A4Y7T591_COPMI|nr:hypothetical protein FA13DRAFT_665753 [Coprinellus micaceus]